MEKIHLIGICGMAMGSLAGMLKARGYDVRGSDEHVYPPMSDQLAQLGIPYFEGFRAENLDWQPDRVVIGNVVSRNHPEAIATMERGLPYSSQADALAELFIQDRHSVVVTGTHGKTTTTGIIAWTLHHAGRNPGFLVGGVLTNFQATYGVGNGQFFVVEGDEYDTAYFDKTPKFLHYRPKTGLMTSIEFDHADIYNDLEQIKQEFRKFAALIPADGLLVACADEPNIREVLSSATAPIQTYGEAQDTDWRIGAIEKRNGLTAFTVLKQGVRFAEFETPMIGRHNLWNLLGATAVLHHLGLSPEEIRAGFREFKGTKRRQEVRCVANGVTVIDDFAHHPTAVKLTIDAVKTHYSGQRVWCVFEPRTATTRRDVFQRDYADAFMQADVAVIANVDKPEKAPEGHRFSSERLVSDLRERGIEAHHISAVDDIVAHLAQHAKPGDVALIMSNGGFGGIHQKLLTALNKLSD